MAERSQQRCQFFDIDRFGIWETEKLMEGVKRVTTVKFEVVSCLDHFVENKLVEMVMVCTMRCQSMSSFDLCKFS